MVQRRGSFVVIFLLLVDVRQSLAFWLCSSERYSLALLFAASRPACRHTQTSSRARSAPCAAMRLLLCVALLLSALSAGASPVHVVNDHAVRELVGRMLGEETKAQIVLGGLPIGKGGGDGKAGNGRFEISTDPIHNKPRVLATTTSALSSGLYFYLRYVCNCSVTWGRRGSGTQLGSCTSRQGERLPLPSRTVSVTAPVRWRYYMNVCTIGYSSAFWHWERWEWELDWMALHGVNLPLSFTGQEYVFERLYREFGLTNEEIDAHFAGYAFLPWGRMGNIRGWGGPLSSHWRQDQYEMHKKILARAEELGMTPVLPGFAGHVPAALVKHYPNSTFTRSAGWGHFNSTYSQDYLLQPADPLFEKIGSRFIELQHEMYQTSSHVYNADTFNEMRPSTNHSNYIAEAGYGTYRAINKGDDKGIWLMQGWLFEDTEFWKPSVIKNYLSKIPDDRMIILDLFSDVEPIFSKTDNYFGKSFIWCMLLDFGGKRGMFGNLTNIGQSPVTSRTSPGSTMIGTGMTPEAIENNPVMFELMSEMGWRTESLAAPNSNSAVQSDSDFFPQTIDSWVERYIEQRYGAQCKSCRTAWHALTRSAYNDRFMEVSIVQLRPWFNLSSRFYGPGVQERYDATKILASLRSFSLSASELPDVENNGPWKYDAVDLARQVRVDHVFRVDFALLLTLFSSSPLLNRWLPTSLSTCSPCFLIATRASCGISRTHQTTFRHWEKFCRLWCTTSTISWPLMRTSFLDPGCTRRGSGESQNRKATCWNSMRGTRFVCCALVCFLVCMFFA
jgi:alpha-N-acetylglucosaminidase